MTDSQIIGYINEHSGLNFYIDISDSNMIGIKLTKSEPGRFVIMKKHETDDCIDRDFSDDEEQKRYLDRRIESIRRFYEE